MAYAHVGHDAQVGDKVVLSNGVQIGGHVIIGADAVLGARAAIHQFVRIGRGAMVAAGSMVIGDVPPWTLVAGDRARIVGPNTVALKAHCSEASIARIRRALRLALPPVGRVAIPTAELVAHMPDPGEAASDPVLGELIAFLAAPSRRALCRRTRK
jgi:UDP-N-acetylglucosamine acyltransferase